MMSRQFENACSTVISSRLKSSAEIACRRQRAVARIRVKRDVIVKVQCVAAINPRDRKDVRTSRQCKASAVAASSVGTAAPGTFSHVAAVALGWAVIAGSWFRSVPQILRIMRAGNAAGLSVTANIVETLCYTIIVGYNVNHMYPFSTYGDVFACWLQDIVVTGLIVHHLRPSAPLVLLGVAFFVASSWWVMSGACGLHVLAILQVGSSFAMALGARIPQIMLNMKRGNSGEMAPISSGLSVAGNLVRVFTTMALTADLLLLAGNLVQLVLNSILFFQTMQTEMHNRNAAASLGVQNA